MHQLKSVLNTQQFIGSENCSFYSPFCLVPFFSSGIIKGIIGESTFDLIEAIVKSFIILGVIQIIHAIIASDKNNKRTNELRAIHDFCKKRISVSSIFENTCLRFSVRRKFSSIQQLARFL